MSAPRHLGDELADAFPADWDAAFSADAPRHDDTALVFTVGAGDGGAPRATAMARAAAGAVAPAGAEPASGLQAVRGYLDRHRRASLSRLSAEGARRPAAALGGAAAVRALDARATRAAAASDLAPPGAAETHFLRLASAAHAAALEDALRRDPLVGGRVHRPAIQYPIVAPRSATSAPGSQLWALEKCGFLKAWPKLDVGDDPGPIAVIDAGAGGLRHPSVKPRISRYTPPQAGPESRAAHGGAVSAVIAAIRDIPTIAGGCSALLRVYNVWTESEFDSKAYYDALRDVAQSDARVLNLSLGSTEHDPEAEQAIKECIARGVVVVAAMGDLEEKNSPAIFPARTDGVIAVGATDRHDHKRKGSSRGKHIWIAAPGEDIWTVVGDDVLDFWGGTSFAAALVTAAAWLMVRARPAWGPDRVREVLKRCVDGKSVTNGGRSQALGHGRLDLTAMMQQLALNP